MPEIKPSEYYTTRKLVSMKIVPWSSAMTFNKKLTEQKWIDIFNPFVEVVEGKKYIRIKGENIIKFLELAANGQFK